MQDFQFFVTDDRYSVPSLMFVQTRDLNAARTLAEQMLTHAHYCAVEVWAGEVRLFTVERPAGYDPPRRRHVPRTVHSMERQSSERHI